MKMNYLNSLRIPLLLSDTRKCDSAGWLSAGASALGVVSGLFTRNSDRKYQAEQARLEREWQSQENQKNRDFSQSMFDQTNEWNSASSQVKRLQAAGINPNVAFSNSAGNAGTAQSVPAGSSGAGASAGSAPSMQNFTSGFSDIAQAFLALSKAENTDQDTEYLKKTMVSRIKDQEFKTFINQIIADNQEDMTKKQLSILDKTISKLQEEIFNVASDTLVKEQDVNESKARAKELISRAGLNDKTADQLQRYMDNYFDREHEAQIRSLNTGSDLNVAKSGEARANASLANANAKTVNDIREYVVDEHKYSAGLQHLAYDLKNASYESEKKAIIQEFTQQAARAGVITAQMQADLDRALKNNDWYEVDKIFNMVDRYVGRSIEAAHVVSEFLPTKFSSSYSSNTTYFDEDGNVRGWSDVHSNNKGTKSK